MSCQTCKSDRILKAYGKCSDRFEASIGDVDYSGYVPEDLGIGGEDDISFNLCLDCGQFQGNFPLPSCSLESKLSDQEVLDFYRNHFCENDQCITLHRSTLLAAESLDISLLNFLKKFINYNKYSRKTMPSANVFLNMFKDKDYIL